MVLRELLVLGETAVQLAGSEPTAQMVHLARAQRVRLVVLERLVSLVQVQPVLREQKVHLVLRVQPVLEELAVQLAGSVPTEQKVHLERARPVLRVCLELLVPRRTGRGR